VKGGGSLGSRKSIKIPGGKHELLPVLHPLDEADLINYAIRGGMDFVALPYSIRKKDIQHVRDFMGPHGAHI
jgi:pyruvate kinase